ncbi:alcohol dehydrogenase catalytic domain-containing protein [Alteromonas macleodii]|uniref:Zinc-containing alcohol dehydrogenase n=1 Tax=Alteromonas macleodii (strain English Channel 673) TaxID=1004788 RepID=A0AB32ZWJ2_ALTME|nr:alcohol dehydrogenase catalytic domain-containing protein [Alteromonas macleodii]AFT73776.1 zinc-containing alcohol dehydrogenase [Alteromonas macleodii str. 'English Channel 673']MBL3808710.1 alcohol dehydrogenase catalytic domain-containing protein [Alteromonas macleodii]MBL3882247.1 alcohol dehydrogenase catalytic domain-containing protein [Alteromonas macleodii]
MQANVWQFEQAGASLVKQVREFSEPKAGRIVVRNYAIGINPVDWKFIDDNPRDWEKGHVPGVDGAGVVVAVGEGVDNSLRGKRVTYHHSLGENGSFADHSEVYASRVMLVPESVDFALAAALPCPMLTAWQAFSKVPVRNGADVLVSGMGAVNKLLAQMLSQAGFSVHVISGSFTQEQADEMGVKAIHRGKPEGQTFYALFDANGPDYAASLVPLLEANGHVVSILGRIEVPVDAPFTRTISYHEIALGALHDYGDLSQWQRLVKDGEALLEQVAAQTLVVEIPNVFDFNNLNEALQFSKEDKRKAVVTVS